MRNQFALILLVVLAVMGCRTTGKSDESGLTTTKISNTTLPVEGCYRITFKSGEEFEIGTADRLCIGYSNYSQSGLYTFEFSGSGEVINTIGASPADVAQSCPNCFEFTGIDGDITFDATQKDVRKLIVKRPDNETYVFSLVDAPTGLAAIEGCYLVLGFDGTFGILSASDFVCLRRTDESHWSFEFRENGEVLLTVEKATNGTSPADCSNCYSFESPGGSIMLRAESRDDFILHVTQTGEERVEFSLASASEDEYATN